MKTVGFLLFVLVGFAGSMLFIYYMLSPYLNETDTNMIAGDYGVGTALPTGSTPTLTPTPTVAPTPFEASPTPYVGPGGVPYNYY